MLLILLDGLDEIPDIEDRSQCVRLLNEIIPAFGAPLVVCCRRAEYEGLGVQLSLQQEVSIRKLEEAELMRAIRGQGRALSGVRAVLQDDPSLRKLCRAPLFLSMVTATYAGQPATRIRSSGTPVERRAKLLADYVDRRLLRIDKHTSLVVTAQQAADARRNRDRLMWLARGMLSANLTLCSLEQLGPSWLPAPFRVAALIPSGFVFVVGQRLVSTGVGAELALFFFASTAFRCPPSGRLVWSWRKATDPSTLVLSGLVGFVLGEVLGLVHVSQVPQMTLWPVHWTVPTIVGCALVGIALGCPVISLVLGFGAAPISTKRSPYDGLRRSALTGALIGLAVLAGGALVYLLVIKVAGISRFVVIRAPLPITSSSSVIGGLGFVLPAALIFALIGGLGAALGHLWMRVCIWASQRGPLRYVRWLDEMVADRILFRSGSAYGFIHRLVLEDIAGVRPTADSRVVE
jgi:hypothetical protein